MPAWYTEFTEAVDAGDPQYRECESCGAACLPPRSRCPSCGEGELVDRPLSPTATVASFSTIHVTMPEFHGETPYTVALAAFDEGVRLTGQFRGDDVDLGDTVVLGTEEREGPTILTFTPETADG